MKKRRAPGGIKAIINDNADLILRLWHKDKLTITQIRECLGICSCEHLTVFLDDNGVSRSERYSRGREISLSERKARIDNFVSSFCSKSEFPTELLRGKFEDVSPELMSKDWGGRGRRIIYSALRYEDDMCQNLNPVR